MKNYKGAIFAGETPDLHLEFPRSSLDCIATWFAPHYDRITKGEDLIRSVLKEIYGLEGNIKVNDQNFKRIQDGFNIIIDNSQIGRIDIRARTVYDFVPSTYITIGAKEANIETVRYFEHRRNSDQDSNLTMFKISKKYGTNGIIVNEFPSFVKVTSNNDTIEISCEKKELIKPEKLMQLESATITGKINFNPIKFVEYIQGLYGMRLTEFRDIDILFSRLNGKNEETTGAIYVAYGELDEFKVLEEESSGNSYKVIGKPMGSVRVEGAKILDSSEETLSTEGRIIKDKYNDFIGRIKH